MVKFDKNKQVTIFLVLIIAWYLISFLIPYNTLANSLGIVNLSGGHSWPLSFFLMDVLVIISTVLFIIVVMQSIKKKQFQWLLLVILLIWPLITVWTTLQDLIFSPIAP